MTTQVNRTWTADELANFGDALASGYVPGLRGAKMAKGDRWTAQRHIQASAARAQAYL